MLSLSAYYIYNHYVLYVLRDILAEYYIPTVCISPKE